MIRIGIVGPAALAPKSNELYEIEHFDSVENARGDYVIVCGDRHGVESHDNRLLALHDADLTLLDDNGRPRYTGSDAVADALFDGQNETRTTLSFVNGPAFLLSDPFPVAPLAIDARNCGDAQTLMQYAQLHRKWMQRSAWPMMLQKAVEFLAMGTVQLIGNVAWIDGVPGPCRLGHSPAVCAQHEGSIRRTIPASCPLIQV
jgi:hypothetical protein